MVIPNHYHERFSLGAFFRRAVLLVLAAFLSAAFSEIWAQVNNDVQKKVLVFHLLRRDDASALVNERVYRKALNDGLAGLSVVSRDSSAHGLRIAGCDCKSG